MCKAILLIHQKLWILDQCTTEALNRTQQVTYMTQVARIFLQGLLSHFFYSTF